MATLRIHTLAQREYEEAIEWYAKSSHTRAIRFIDEVESMFANIEQFPDRYPECDYGCREAILVRYPYIVVYRVSSADKVTVIAVAHASREPGYWSNRIP